MKPTDKAFQKAALGLPLSEEESSLIEKAQREAAQRKEKENVLQGAGIAITRKNDKNKKEATVSITLDKGQKAEFLEKAEKYLVSQMKDFLKNEGKDLHEVKKAVEQYEKNPNAETAARVAEAYEKTAVAIGAGFTPIAGDVIDGFIALKDVYRGDYLSAGISTAAMFTPFLPATVAKKISKAIFETPLGKKIADSSFGKWAIARFGKKADDVGEGSEKAQHTNKNDLTSRTADDVNAEFPGYNPPYLKGTKVQEYTIVNEEEFVRVHGIHNRERSWMMKEEAIRGLSREEIARKYSLPELPTHISDVTAPSNTRIRKGRVNSNFGGNQGAIQYQWLGRVPSNVISNTRPLR
jgi:hypothetical protein